MGERPEIICRISEALQMNRYQSNLSTVFRVRAIFPILLYRY